MRHSCENTRLLLIVIPIAYAALMGFSAAPSLFPVDDPYEFRFVAESESFFSLLGTDVFQLFRPIKNLLFVLFSFLAPLGIRWCHWVCILIGALSFFPVRALCRCILGSESKAILAASIWLFAPTLVSSAAWLSAVNILVMVAFAAGTIVLHDSAWNCGGQFKILLAGICLFFSLISYECAVAVIPLLILFDLYLRPGRIRTKTAIESYGFYLTIAALYLVLRHAVSAKTEMSGVFFVETTRLQAIASSPWFVFQHFFLWFWPFDRLFILGSYRWGQIHVWKLAVCWTGILLAACWCFSNIRKNSVSKFCLVFFLAGFAPTSNCLGFRNGPYFDCYMALASVGLAAWVANRIVPPDGLAGKRNLPDLLLAVVLAATRIFGVVESAAWTSAWGNGTKVIALSIQNHPEFFPNKALLASLTFRKDHYEESLRLCQEVEAAVYPDMRHMVPVFELRGAYELEINHNAESALRLFDNIPRVDASEESKKKWHFNRGRVFEMLQKDLDTAAKEYEMAVAGKNPNLGAAHRLALVKAQQGRQDEAVTLWERIIRIKPDDENALWHLAMAYRSDGDEARATHMESRALKVGRR